MTPPPAKSSEAPFAGRHAIPIERRLLVGGLLLTSFACNLTVLFIPFMEMRTGLAEEPYSLFHSAQMLWTSGLQVLAVLVVAFSVVFPFVKLGVLTWICGAGTMDERNHRWLVWVERLGKWSMLDVFLVCLILALASGQVLVGARPLVGLPVFVAAIILSLASGELLTAALPPVPSPQPASLHAFRRSGWWLALSGISLAGATSLPFLQTHDWFVADKAYSIATAVPTLARSGAALPGAIIGLFLIVVPVATWAVTCAWWWKLRSKRPAQRLYRLMLVGRRWSMLDVFALALAIFAVEGGSLIKTQVQWGALFLAALVAAQLILQAALGRALERD